MTSRRPNQNRLQLSSVQPSLETQRRLCLEVRCTVQLSHCNVITWFERQVQKKLKTSPNGKWRLYLDKHVTLSFLRRRGAFLYEKYLSELVPQLHEYNRKLIQYMAWVEFLRKEHPDVFNGNSDELSLRTLFDTSSLQSRYAAFSQESAIAINTQQSLEFEYDLDIITSTQRSEVE